MERTIEIDIGEELLKRLDERASQVGVDRSSYVRRLIERALVSPRSAATLSELLAPIHDYTEAQGLSETEIERFFTDQVTECRERRRHEEGGRPVR